MAIWQIDDDYYVDLDQSMVCWKQDAQWHQKSLTPLRQKAVQVVIGDGEADQLVRWKEIISGVYGYEDSLDGRRNFNDLKNILENEYKFTYLESDRGNGYRLRAPKLRRVAKIPSVPPKKPEGDSPAAPNDPPKTEAPRTLAPQQVLDLLYGSEAQRRAVLHRAPEVPQRAVAKTDFMTAVLPTFLLEAWQRLSAQQQTELLQGENRMGWWDARCQIQTDNYYSVEELVKNCRTLLQREVETHGLAQELIDLVRWMTAENDAYVPVERALFLSEADGYPERGVAILLLAALMGPGAFADLFAGSGYRYFMQ